MSRFRSVSEVAASFCRGGRFRPVSEIEARVSERGSIPSSFRNLEGLSWEGVVFRITRKLRQRSGEGGVDFARYLGHRSADGVDSAMFLERRSAFGRGPRFQALSLDAARSLGG